MDGYEVITLIGEGSFGRVYKARKKQSVQDVVALKLISKYNRSQKEIMCLRQECDIQKDLNHPNIIRMIDSFETENEIVVVTEFARRDLYQILGEHCYLSEDKARKIICDLTSALYYLHSNRVLHRDLKPQNILLTCEGVAKLCDFGFARHMGRSTHVLTSIKGTPLYMAPELMDESPYDHTADLWSLGCISYEMLTGTPPFLTKSILHLVNLIKHEHIKWPDFLSEDCLSFLKGVLNKNPDERLSWPHLLNHPFLQGKVLVLDNLTGSTPLTVVPTSSQMISKQKQKISCVLKTINRIEDSNQNGTEIQKNNHNQQDYKKCDNDIEATGVRNECNEEDALGEEETGGEGGLDAEEWLEFLQNSLEEVMLGDVECVGEPAFVAMVTRALSSFSPSVIEYIATLFSIPFVTDSISSKQIDHVRKVYSDTKLIRKLVGCSKVLLDRSGVNGCGGEVSAETLQALEAVFVLLTSLSTYYPLQLLNALESLQLTSHLTTLLSLRKRKLHLAHDIFAIFIILMSSLPNETSPLLKKVFLGFCDPESEVRSMLCHSSSNCLKKRLLTLIKLVAVNSGGSAECSQVMERIWSYTVQNDVEALSYDSCQTIRQIAEDVINELKTKGFYKTEITL